MYYEATVNYWDDNPNGFKPPVIKMKRVLLVRAYNYTEVETVCHEWAETEVPGKEITISPIKELPIYTVVEAGKENDPFYKVEVLYPEENDKGKIKIQKISLIMQAESDMEVLKETVKYFDFLPSREDLKIKSVTLTDIEEYLKLDD